MLFKGLIGLLSVTAIGLFIFGAANAYKTLIEFNWESFIILLVISGIVTIIPRVVQYLVALREELDTEYRLWWGGISVIIITLLPLFTTIFGQPVKMVIRNEVTHIKREIFITKIAGPLTTIMLSVVFFLMYSNSVFFSVLINWPSNVSSHVGSDVIANIPDGRSDNMGE